LGSPRWCRRACFHARARPVRLDRPPGVVRLASLFLLRCLFRAPSRSPLPHRFGRSVLPGSRSLFATSPERVHQSQGLPGPRSVPSTGVRSLSTAYSSLGLRGLFHPRATFRDVSTVQGLLSPRSAAVSSTVASPLPLAHRSLGQTLRSAVRVRRPRLRGFLPREGAFSPASALA